MAYYFPKKPVKLDYIYFHVGRFVVRWADAEDAIDSCLRLFAAALNDPLYQIPRSTKRRIEAFKAGLAKCRLSPEQHSRGKALLARFEAIVEHRHWAVHAVLWNESWEAKTTFVSYLRVSLSDGGLEQRDYDLAEIEELADECGRLHVELWDWLTSDLGASTPKKAEKAARKIGVKLPRKLPVRKHL
ncbi:MAG: hypothetical protein Q8S58_20400 [Bosea sp. (in: a-proteobacteria)]|uniref:hypothetical protein n=1 Tax=Bosea sp. (in: a-proteobacteria) TaxID=1871050 RepID=UPI00273726CC|nr:hypothetical protein [Bosea sp. (in: a-proteobacteria)]MDP3257327.1 hypothetical protein [Bosea sp. (in: a-proteobacteria)]MDP3321491.1 hypothetical protein [Bosea sp. (in: a-proteobacteria)]